MDSLKLNIIQIKTLQGIASLMSILIIVILTKALQKGTYQYQKNTEILFVYESIF